MYPLIKMSIHDQICNRFAGLLSFGVTTKPSSDTVLCKRLRISPIVRVILIPSRSDLKNSDLWWSNDVIDQNKNEMTILYNLFASTHPTIPIKELKKQVITELCNDNQNK